MAGGPGCARVLFESFNQVLYRLFHTNGPDNRPIPSLPRMRLPLRRWGAIHVFLLAFNDMDTRIRGHDEATNGSIHQAAGISCSACTGCFTCFSCTKPCAMEFGTAGQEVRRCGFPP
jgi:hypothetical protein